MALLSRSFIKHFPKSIGVLQASRDYVLKYVDTTKYDVDDVKIITDNDPKAVKIIEKHGKAWHIMNEGKKASLALAVSGDFDMFNGLPREFVLHFNTDQKGLREKNYPLGSCVPVVNNSHFIYYLIIRENWWDRGAYRPMRESLQAMREHALLNNVKNIAMGRLGGQDEGLDFNEVLIDLKKVFYDSNIDLTIYPRRT